MLAAEVVAAPVGEAAGGAFGGAGGAGVAAVEDEPVVGAGAKVDGDVPLEILLDRERGLAVGEAETVGDAEDVGVDGDDGLVVDDGGDDVGGLAADAGQGHEGVDVSGNLSAEVGQEFLGHGDEVVGLGVGIGNAADIGPDVVEGSGGQQLRRRKALEEGRGDEVDAPVGALGGEDDGDEQLEGVRIMEFGGGEGNVLLKPSDNRCKPFFFSHTNHYLFYLPSLEGSQSQ